MGIRTVAEVEGKMSLRHEKKAFKMTIKIFIYAPYAYTMRLMIRIVNYITRTVSNKKLVDVVYSFE